MNKYQCTISELPTYSGNGFSYGGEVIITIDARESDFIKPLFSLSLGSKHVGKAIENTEPMKIARIIQAALHNYHETPDNLR
jgi:hypothetical protein